MLTPGAQFAGYRVERILGRGGMGDVYLARHPRLPRSDALKLISEELSRNEVYRQRFSAEADIASQIQHDCVVRVYDRGEDDGRLWLAMEYIDGRDLAEILTAESRLSPDRAVALCERIASGLDAIHSRGLLHRDVKPANILVARDLVGEERALLIDFGIARSAADSLGLTGVGDIVATLHYAAPEQFELRSFELDRRVDVYALGCVLYEMLTGQVPLVGDSVADFWRVMQSQTPLPASERVAGISGDLDSVLAKALSKQRESRYGSAGELARAARLALAGAPTLVTAPPSPFQAAPGSPAPGAGSDGPYRVVLQREDLDAHGGSRKWGPISTPELSSTEAQRLRWLILTSNVFSFPSRLVGGSGANQTLTVESPGRVHNVSWVGQPPPKLMDLVADIERLGEAASASRPPVAAAAAPGPPAPSAAGGPKRGNRRLLVAGLALIVVIAAAVVIPILLLGKKPVPGVPQALRGTPGRGTVTLTWQRGSGTTDHYVVYRGDDVIAPTVTATTFTDKLTNTQPHTYAVQAVNAKGTQSALTPPLRIAAQVRPLNAGELALVAKLPPNLVNKPSCLPILSGVNVNLNVAITCGPGAGQSPPAPGVVPKTVEAYGANSITQLEAALKNEINTHGAKSGACTATPQQGTWNFTETPKILNGQIVCYVVEPNSYLLWSYTNQKFYVRISTTSPYADLLKYWQNAALHLP